MRVVRARPPPPDAPALPLLEAGQGPDRAARGPVAEGEGLGGVGAGCEVLGEEAPEVPQLAVVRRAAHRARRQLLEGEKKHSVRVGD